MDEIVSATGFRPDLGMLCELRLALDPIVESPAALASVIDHNVHSCGTVPPHGEEVLRQPEAGFYLAGMKSYGRAPPNSSPPRGRLSRRRRNRDRGPR